VPRSGENFQVPAIIADGDPGFNAAIAQGSNRIGRWLQGKKLDTFKEDASLRTSSSLQK